MEVMDDLQMSVINRSGATPYKVWDEVPTLFFKFSGTQAGVRDCISIVDQLVKKNNGNDFTFARTDKEATELWKARKESLWSTLALRKEGDEVWSTDVGVPISRLPDIIAESKASMENLGIFASILGHVGDGNFHTSILYQRNDAAERAKVEKFVHDMVDTAIEMDGTCTGEHSIGLGKKVSLVKELSVETIGVMVDLKRSLDPHWLMNPGKIFDPDPSSTKEYHEVTAAAILDKPKGQ
jgi:D-lactate dehydrogenase (cytochrome)